MANLPCRLASEHGGRPNEAHGGSKHCGYAEKYEQLLKSFCRKKKCNQFKLIGG